MGQMFSSLKSKAAKAATIVLTTTLISMLPLVNGCTKCSSERKLERTVEQLKNSGKLRDAGSSGSIKEFAYFSYSYPLSPDYVLSKNKMYFLQAKSKENLLQAFKKEGISFELSEFNKIDSLYSLELFFSSTVESFKQDLYDRGLMLFDGVPTKYLLNHAEEGQCERIPVILDRRDLFGESGISFVLQPFFYLDVYRDGKKVHAYFRNPSKSKSILKFNEDYKIAKSDEVSIIDKDGHGYSILREMGGLRAYAHARDIKTESDIYRINRALVKPWIFVCQAKQRPQRMNDYTGQVRRPRPLYNYYVDNPSIPVVERDGRFYTVFYFNTNLFYTMNDLIITPADVTFRGTPSIELRWGKTRKKDNLGNNISDGLYLTGGYDLGIRGEESSVELRYHMRSTDYGIYPEILVVSGDSALYEHVLLAEIDTSARTYSLMIFGAEAQRYSYGVFDISYDPFPK